jgi:hypothetical protein
VYTVLIQLDEAIEEMRHRIEQLTKVRENLTRVYGNGDTPAKKAPVREEIAIVKGNKRGHRPQYTPDFKRQVVAEIRSGLSYGEASKKHGITWFTARNWDQSTPRRGRKAAAA